MRNFEVHTIEIHLNTFSRNLSFENLQWLTIEQTLGDIAEFITFIRNEHFGYNGGNVVLWGSGFGASLAGWARVRYPHLVDSVWASSGLFNLQLESTSKYTPTIFQIFFGKLLIINEDS